MSATPKPYLEKHVLVCNGESCGPQGGVAVRTLLKQTLRDRGLRKLYRDGECSCMGLCRDGVNAVIWPEGTYLAGLSEGDIPRLVDYLAGSGPALTDLEARATEKIRIKTGAN